MYKKVLLMTGGSSGLGRTMSNHLSKAGYAVYGTSRKIEGELKTLITSNSLNLMLRV
jgi:NADP-dependent 3-hydroxy acid dehydrogenase YdfG